MKPALGRSSRLLLSVAVIIALVGLLMGCGGGGGGLPDFENLILSYYYVTGDTVQPFAAAVRDQVQMLAFGETAGGEHQTLTDQVTWSSSDPAVATISATGLLEAVSPGATDITITYGDLEPVSLTVTVEAYQDMPTTPYYPFGRTHYWAYTGTPVSPSLAAQETTPSLTITTPVQVVIEGQVWWELQIQGTDPSEPPGRMWLRHQLQGLVEYVGGSARLEYWLKEPLQAGNHWDDSSYPDHYWDIIATDATVTVPAGTYNDCFQVVEHWVTLDNIPYQSTAWFAPGVGLVQSLTEWTDPDLGPQTDEQYLLQVQFDWP